MEDLNTQFKSDLKLMALAARGGGPSELRRVYLQLAKTYHPDSHPREDQDFHNRAMALLNQLYLKLGHPEADISLGAWEPYDSQETKPGSQQNRSGEQGSHKQRHQKSFYQGRYRFRNRYGVEESSGDLVHFLLKRGIDAIDRARDLLADHPLVTKTSQEDLILAAVEALSLALASLEEARGLGAQHVFREEILDRLGFAYHLNRLLTRRIISETGSALDLVE